MPKLKPNQFYLSGHLITERPILFQTEMVQANLEDRKTQTRREVKNVTLHELPFGRNIEFIHKTKKSGIYGRTDKEHLASRFLGIGSVCPYGKPGDLLWVREKMILNKISETYWPVADGYYKSRSIEKVVPSIHMPKIAARIWLMVEDIRVERVQDISEADAKAEGIKTKPYGSHPYFCTIDYQSKPHKSGFRPGFCADTGRQFRSSFESLWKSINGKESWNANPWVWVVRYRILSKTGRPAEKTILHHFVNIVKGEKNYMTI